MPLDASTKLDVDNGFKSWISQMNRKPNSDSGLNAATSALSEREKQKGNESFKSGDYADAIIHYTRSISYQPRAVVFSNRSLAHAQLKDQASAERDVTCKFLKNSLN